jgi:hypothetical protein
VQLTATGRTFLPRIIPYGQSVAVSSGITTLMLWRIGTALENALILIQLGPLTKSITLS